MPQRVLTPSEYQQLSLMNIGERVRYIRKLISDLYEEPQLFSTTQLAKFLGVKPQTLTAIERNDVRNPSFKIIAGLSRAFGVPMEVFEDEYYNQQSINLFTIGKDDSSIDQVKDQHHVIADITIPIDERSFKMSFQIEQVFDNGDRKQLYSRTTQHPTDIPSCIRTLARFITEIDLLEQQDLQYSLQDSNSYNRALSQYIQRYKFSDQFKNYRRVDE